LSRWILTEPPSERSDCFWQFAESIYKRIDVNDEICSSRNDLYVATDITNTIYGVRYALECPSCSVANKSPSANGNKNYSVES
jgi:hypothetical protein